MKKFGTAILYILSAAVLFCSCGRINPLGIFGGETTPAVFDESFFEPEYVNYEVSRLLYEELLSDEQQAYRSLYNGVVRHLTRVAVPKLTNEQFKTVFYALTRDNPHIICLENEFNLVSSGGVLYLLPHYSMNEKECSEKTAELMSRAELFINGTQGLSEQYDKELYLHDMLIKECDYLSLNSSNAYNACVNGSSDCTGYALGMKLLLDKCGIKCCAVRGNVTDKHSTGSHLWLIVCINSRWYHLDPTWDDPIGGTGTPEHSYFNVSTKSISATHSDFSLPGGIECNSEAANYYIVTDRFCSSENTDSVIYKELSSAKRLSDFSIEVRFSSNMLMHTTLLRLENGLLQSWLQNYTGKDYVWQNMMFCTSTVNEEMNILQLDIKL